MNPKYLALCLATAALGLVFSTLQIAIDTGTVASQTSAAGLPTLSAVLGIAFTMLSSLVWLQGDLHDYSDSQASPWAKQVVIGMVVSAVAYVPFFYVGSLLAAVVAATGSFMYVYLSARSSFRPVRRPVEGPNATAYAARLIYYAIASSFTVLLAIVELKNRQPGDYAMLYGYLAVFLCQPWLLLDWVLQTLGAYPPNQLPTPGLIAGFCLLNAATWLVALKVRKRGSQQPRNGGG